MKPSSGALAGHFHLVMFHPLELTLELKEAIRPCLPNRPEEVFLKTPREGVFYDFRKLRDRGQRQRPASPLQWFRSWGLSPRTLDTWSRSRHQVLWP